MFTSKAEQILDSSVVTSLWFSPGVSSWTPSDEHNMFSDRRQGKWKIMRRQSAKGPRIAVGGSVSLLQPTGKIADCRVGCCVGPDALLTSVVRSTFLDKLGKNRTLRDGKMKEKQIGSQYNDRLGTFRIFQQIPMDLTIRVLEASDHLENVPKASLHTQIFLVQALSELNHETQRKLRPKNTLRITTMRYCWTKWIVNFTPPGILMETKKIEPTFLSPSLSFYTFQPVEPPLVPIPLPSQQQQQPPPYPTFYGIAPPPEMSSSMAYLSAQLGYMHEYMTQTFTNIDAHLERQGDRIRIEGHLLIARLEQDDHASGFARQTSSH
ncbi:hypothetical protein Syun_001557 [Stephania yunnanensis]|uniref:Uncharacterized protein n=1 Tax=Stephania yunnanensis TaxID=152371 RepID=A0AAP0Q6E2_9MAGN